MSGQDNDQLMTGVYIGCSDDWLTFAESVIRQRNGIIIDVNMVGVRTNEEAFDRLTKAFRTFMPIGTWDTAYDFMSDLQLAEPDWVGDIRQALVIIRGIEQMNSNIANDLVSIVRAILDRTVDDQLYIIAIPCESYADVAITIIAEENKRYAPFVTPGGNIKLAKIYDCRRSSWVNET